MAADGLPPEILAEIFSHLPVKSLLRFRSTSKSLKSLIDSHNFINLHLKNNSLNRSLILHYKSELYQIDDFPDLTKSMIPLNHPFNTAPVTYNSIMALLGSCNGLLAISNGQIAFMHPYGANEITIWNPNTRKHRIIPFLPLAIPNILESDKPNRGGICVHGFGFDPSTGDYKLLRISWMADGHCSFYDSHVSLFSLKTNSWKTIPSMPYALQYVQAMGVFVQNSLHWVMTQQSEESHPCFIVAFNLTLEIFNVVPLPAEIESIEVNSECESFQIAVAVLGGCLCMILNYQTTKTDVWVMKDYGSSWCKLFTLVNSCFTLSLNFLKPLGYSSDGSKVLLEIDCKKLFWCDLMSEQVIYVEGISNLDEAMICVESLVPPSFPVDYCRKKENHTSKNKRRDDFLSRGFKLRL
ncbi:putative F-box domain, galactose oxidase/kelch, beta-propeller, F-box associated interaction [Medicago truncatula]|uniref:F-box and associated interaction domain protein n=1 Tax=Medicago truncatula TaxID=3880 RepID=A0A072V5P2_MEDTR|nr:F-box protein CPR1-like [Medicago truncatula]KEH36956.1 F-box and associated interaction domain protein [Medicago truncatula]RHN72643.1 putative F-box domain, galactose oxidase/kelch, beta-propeller, F-box associated interaction [Medicago truncatula]